MSTPDAGTQQSVNPKVLYIVGKGRSGSTLLDMILGEIDGYFSAGQLSTLWTFGLINRYLCGCGRPVPECPVWSAVLREAFHDPPDPHRMEKLQSDVLSWRRAQRVLRSAGRPAEGWPELEEYEQVLVALYRAIAKVTGARVIVDSSKFPAHPGSLGLIRGISPYLVHLVRDPRAVAYSWRRRVPQRTDLKQQPRFGPTYSSLSWLARNAVADRVRRSLGEERSMLVRYEDFVADPVETVSQITRMVGEKTELPFVDDTTVKLSVNHTVSGNPIRMDVGEITVKPDAEWEGAIRRWDRAVASIVSAPLRRRYGY